MALTSEELESSLNALSKRITKMEKQLVNVITTTQLNAAFLILENDVNTLKEEIATLKTRIATLEGLH